MHKWLLTFLICLLAGCKADAPPVVLELHDGNQLKTERWQGKWVYINYWAEWCKPCKEEIPALNAYARANSDALVLGVHFDKPSGIKLLNQINLFRIEYGVVVNDIQMAFQHPVPSGLPVTYVYNPEGKLVKTLQGPQTVAGFEAARQ
jgi:thiol-disulfide isomerase/thioredoxin